MKKTVIILGIVGVVVSIILVRMKVFSQGAGEVLVEEVEYHVINSSVLASGSLIYDEEVNLTTEDIGRVTAVFVEEADTVHQEQLLLQIDDETFS